MSGYNLPPGCSQRDIDAVFGTDDDLDACFEPNEEPEPEEDDREPDYNYTPFEESQSYRESLRDAGRGHLLR